MRVALAVNPSSGQGRGRKAGEAAQQRLAAAGIETDVLIGKDAADLTGQLQHSFSPRNEDRVDALVVCGGDGMVQLGVTALAKAGWPAPFGIIPAGTGNDVARALGLPIGDAAAAAEVVAAGLAAGRTRAVDVVRCTDQAGQEHWFTGVLGAGFDAIVNERANGWRWPRGRAKYVLAVLRELPAFQSRPYTLTLDGERWTGEAMLVAVANAPSYGGGMRICPDARLDDGLLDVLMARPVSKAAFLRIFPRVFSGSHVTDPRVEVRRAREVVVDASGIVGYADGERIAALPLRCELMPGALPAITGNVNG